MFARTLYAYLLSEAKSEEDRASRLRATASAIEALPDGEGVSDTKGKLGSIPLSKRQHTAYTLFVTEHYEEAKKTNQMRGKDIITTLTKRWANVVSEQEKQAWAERARGESKDVPPEIATDLRRSEEEKEI